MRGRRLIPIIGVVVIIGSTAALLTTVDRAALTDALQRADYRTIPLMLLFGVLALAARAARWRLFLDGRLDFAACFHISNIGYMFNNLLPLRAGEAARVLLVAGKVPPIPVMTAISTILLERIVDMLFVFALLGAALTALPVGDVVSAGGVTLALLAALALLILFVGVHRRGWLMRLVGWAGRLFPPLSRLPVEPQITRFLDGLSSLTTPRALLWTVIWTALAWTLSIASSAALLVGFFGTADLAVVLLFSSLSSLTVSAAAAIAYTPAGVGPYHASVIVALAVAGLTQPDGAPLAFAIVLHAINLAMYIAVGVIGLAREGVVLSDLLARLRASVSGAAEKVNG
ncbi:MAG: lysylphosphatidylglycerol synthase transmembrane domain-containing protein [Chloroflexota bacterium]|nr:lysylphosphatidylglycerol synthase transmembrane domain-containing protein [Chloroflexota bacterium]